MTTLVATLTALTGLVFFQRLARDLAGLLVASWTVVGLLFGTFLFPSLMEGALAPLHAASFALAALALATWRRVQDRKEAQGRLALAGIAALVGASLPFVESRTLPRLEPWRLLDRLFASPNGLLFESPLLWAGFLGLAALGLRERRRMVAPLFFLLLVILLSTAHTSDAPFAGGSLHAALPVLGLGLCVSLGWVCHTVAGRPWIPSAIVAASLILWNFLLMWQYGTDRIPRDLTVSFVQVAEVNAALLSRSVGSPPAWPANWLFAWRHRVTPAKYDVVAGRSLLSTSLEGDAFAIDDPRVDPSLLAEGWGRKTTGDGVPCRTLAAGARLFVPLDRARPLAFAVTAGGPGALAVVINSTTVPEVLLGEALARHEIRGGTRLWQRGVNEVRLTYSGPAGARIAGFDFESGVE